MKNIQSKFMMILLIVIVSLIILITVAILSAIFGVFGENEAIKSFAHWGQYAVLGEIVVLFVYAFRKIFSNFNKKIEIYLTFPPELASIDWGDINWDNEKCYISLYDLNEKKKTVKENILLQNNENGTGWQIECPDHVNDRLFDTDHVEIQLTDKKGLEWYVKPFRPLRRSIPIEFLGDKDQLLSYVDNSIER